MKLKNYMTSIERKTLLFLTVLFILATLFSAQTKNESEVLSPDSLEAALQRKNLPNLDIHKATYEEWILVPGLGTKRAKRLVEYRDFYGFSVVNDIMKVKGIGMNTVQKIIAYGYGVGYKSSSATVYKEDNIDTMFDLNKATFEQLLSIKGIGKLRAQGIVEYRDRVGQIKQYEELRIVNGIGPKTIEVLELNTYLGQE